MEIRIGIANASRELTFESAQSADAVREAIAEALESGGVLRLTDQKGGEYLVPVAGLAYVEIGSEEARRVGFVA